MTDPRNLIANTFLAHLTDTDTPIDATAEPLIVMDVKNVRRIYRFIEKCVNDYAPTNTELVMFRDFFKGMHVIPPGTDSIDISIEFHDDREETRDPNDYHPDVDYEIEEFDSREDYSYLDADLS